ncbi:MAG: 4-demethylwyosine synthase TYW1 [Candidatus Woesearchaeota archaeon]
MLNQDAKDELIRQQYRIIGEHSAVKTCGWTKNMIKGKGGCYKLKFYGIMSNQCLQMTTSISCANRCVFCWRGYKAPVSKTWDWNIDDPDMILNNSIRAHHKLLEGFGGQPALKTMYNMSKQVKHVALSLTGEPIVYPRINELIELFDKEGISTFMVTNAQYPEEIKNLKRVTQLYISIDAPSKELLKKIDKPLFSDYWERMNKSLEYCAAKKDRTCIRLTIIKGLNDIDAKGYAELISKGRPDFIEVKAYMHVGPSRERLKMEDMPWHEEIVSFTEELMKYLPEYEIATEHVPSRVVLCARKEFKKNGKWYTWIDFEKWNKLINSGRDFDKFDFLKETPQTGMSGRQIQKEVEAKQEYKKKTGKKNKPSEDKFNAEDACKLIGKVFVDEKTDEMDL